LSVAFPSGNLTTSWIHSQTVNLLSSITARVRRRSNLQWDIRHLDIQHSPTVLAHPVLLPPTAAGRHVVKILKMTIMFSALNLHRLDLQLTHLLSDPPPATPPRVPELLTSTFDPTWAAIQIPSSPLRSQFLRESSSWSQNLAGHDHPCNALTNRRISPRLTRERSWK
jgi:hypothetical protein